MVIWQVWRRPRREVVWGVLAFCVFYGVFEGLALSGLPAHPSAGDDTLVVLLGLAYSLIAGTLLFRVLAHAKVIAGPDGLRISNPFRGDQVVEWRDIAGLEADRLLIVRTTDGRRIIAWAIQKNGWARFRHVTTEADRAVADMGRLAGRALGTGPRDFAARGT